jgi:hypothetical protein
MDPNAPVPRPRGSAGRWLTPDAGSSWPVLWANAAGWAVLLVVWICYLVLADVGGPRRYLYWLLCLVAVFEVLKVAGAMARKRRGPGGA